MYTLFISDESQKRRLPHATRRCVRSEGDRIIEVNGRAYEGAVLSFHVSRSMFLRTLNQEIGTRVVDRNHGDLLGFHPEKDFFSSLLGSTTPLAIYILSILDL